MGHPAKMSVRGACPKCGGNLFRQTDDPKKPLGAVGCSSCSFKSPVAKYFKQVHEAQKAKAMEKIKTAKGE